MKGAAPLTCDNKHKKSFDFAANTSTAKKVRKTKGNAEDEGLIISNDLSLGHFKKNMPNANNAQQFLNDAAKYDENDDNEDLNYDEDIDFSENILFITNDEKLREPDKFLSGMPEERCRRSASCNGKVRSE